MRGLSILVGLAFLTALMAGCLAAPKQGPTADEIAARFVEKQNHVEDYSATVLEAPAGSAHPARSTVQAKRPCSYRFVHFASTGSPERIEIFNGTVLWRYYPESKATEDVTEPASLCSTLRREDYQLAVARIVEENGIAYRGTGGAGGSTTYVIEASPDDPLRYVSRNFSRMRAWIDRDTWMVDRVELYNDGGVCIFTVEYRNVAVNTGISDRVFTFEPPEDATVLPPLIPLTFPPG